MTALYNGLQEAADDSPFTVQPMRLAPTVISITCQTNSPITLLISKYELYGLLAYLTPFIPAIP